MATDKCAGPPEMGGIHFFDIESCLDLAPRDRLLSILRAGRLLNASNWHGQQAWLIRSEDEREKALISLDHLTWVVLLFSKAEEGEVLSQSIRRERDDLRDALSSEGFMVNWESKTEELNALAASQPMSLPLLLIEECKAFLAP